MKTNDREGRAGKAINKQGQGGGGGGVHKVVVMRSVKLMDSQQTKL